MKFDKMFYHYPSLTARGMGLFCSISLPNL